MTQHRTVLEFVSAGFSYSPAKRALGDVSFSVGEGEYVALVGANSSGKSTLAKLAAGLLAPTEGTVKLFGTAPQSPAESFSCRKRIGYVFQNPDDQIVSSLVEDDVAFGPANLGLSPVDLRERVDQALEAVDMGAFARRNVETLSGGQKQRVAVAGALALKPDLLVLDEPCAMLDPAARRDVLGALDSLNRRGMTIFMVTHRMDEVLRASRVIALDAGALVADTTPLGLFANGNLTAQLRLGTPELVKLTAALRERGVPVSPTASARALEEQLCRLLSMA